MAVPTSVIIDGREFIPKTPAANVAWTLGQYLRALRKAAGQSIEEAAHAVNLSAVWLELVEADVDTIRLPFRNVVRLARHYHADIELLAQCYERSPEPADETEVAAPETDEVHDNEAAVVTDYLGLVLPEEPDHG